MKLKRFTAHGAWCVLGMLATLLWAGTAWTQGVTDFELYILDTKTGEVTRVTDTPDYGLFNPSFSHNGKMLVHDAVGIDPVTGWQFSYFGKTDVKTGVTTVDESLITNDSKWSPNGKYIAFDTFFALDYPDWNIYVMPAKGGTPTLLREFAGAPSWSNNSKRIAFADVGFLDSHPDWGYVATIDMDGNEVRLDSVGAYGCALDYSPDGKLIVYMPGDPVTFEGCFLGQPAPLMAVPVNQHGEPLGDPYPLTDGLYIDVWPSVSGNGANVVFHSNRSETGFAPWEFDLWVAPTDGSGQATKLYGLDYVDEFDPSYSKNGRYVVFSSNRDAVLP